MRLVDDEMGAVMLGEISDLPQVPRSPSMLNRASVTMYISRPSPLFRLADSAVSPASSRPIVVAERKATAAREPKSFGDAGVVQLVGRDPVGRFADSRD